MLLYVPEDRKEYQGQETQDSHFDFHTAPELRVVIYYSFSILHDCHIVLMRTNKNSDFSRTE